MLVVTIELWPLGDSTKAQHLGTATIGNDGSGTLKLGNYRVKLSKRGKPLVEWKRGEVIGFPRHLLGPWDLLYRALRATVGYRSKE